jgi:signal transduction histidine kinase
MTILSERDATPIELLAALHDAELRSTAAEVAAAMAHAVGTPLNVIGGRAELIRQNPANALAQVARIEEQVNKLATGLRQLVDYLAPREQPVEDVEVSRVLQELGDLVRPVLGEGAELAVSSGAAGALQVDRRAAVSMLKTLVLWAARSQRASSASSAEHSGKVGVCLEVSQADGNVAFDLHLPRLSLVEGWRLEHFAARPVITPETDPYRMLSICGAIARGQGNKLIVEAASGAPGVRVRYLCKRSGIS